MTVIVGVGAVEPKFENMETPEQIKKYLRNVLSKPGKSGKQKKSIYHYTNISAVCSMLDSGYLWLKSTTEMNDYLERTVVESAKRENKLFFSSFSKIEENLAMYHMYASEPDGVMIEVSYYSAEQILQSIPLNKNGRRLVNVVRNNAIVDEQIEADVYWTAVCYKELRSDKLIAETVSNEKIKKPLMVPELAGFVKLYGWEYEKEIRLCASTDMGLADGEFLAIKIPDSIEIKVVLGPGFDSERFREKYAKLKRMGITVNHSEYDALVRLDNLQGKQIKHDGLYWDEF